MTHRLRHKSRIIGALCAAMVSLTAAAEPDISWNVFTHVEGYAASEETSMSDLRLGESALFVTGRLTDRLSFLAEVSAELPKYRDKTVRVERLRLRYDLNRDHWVILGKVHTPVNYWNDTYHHGRLFFPTINRPLSFNRFIPIHESGLRFAGRQLFGTGMAYDVVLGTGQSTGDHLFEEGVKSTTATISWSSSNRLKWMASYYRDQILDHANNQLHSAHSHGDGPAMPPKTTLANASEDLDYELFSSSLYYEGEAFRSLTEVSANRTDGGDFNRAVFQYLGYQLNEETTAYALYDYVDVDTSEQHFRTGRESRYGLGLEVTLGLNSSLKVELRQRDDDSMMARNRYTELQAQLSFGF